jgi:hypothetical protein
MFVAQGDKRKKIVKIRKILPQEGEEIRGFVSCRKEKGKC